MWMWVAVIVETDQYRNVGRDSCNRNFESSGHQIQSHNDKVYCSFCTERMSLGFSQICDDNEVNLYAGFLHLELV